MSAQCRRVMIVEDEPDIREIAKIALESVGGMEVEVCSGGEEALRKVGEFAPDVVVLDVMMPEMDGPTTLQALRAERATRGIPVVFLSAKVQPDEVKAYRAMGVTRVIAKPFDPMTLAEQVKAAWRHAQEAQGAE